MNATTAREPLVRADGFAEVAVWRASEGRLYIRNGTPVQYGTAGDIPVNKRPSYPGYPY